jgi:hypothetical protein
MLLGNRHIQHDKEGVVSSMWTRTCTAGMMATLALALTSCMCVGERVQLVDMRTEHETVELGEAQEVAVIIDLGVGDCTVTSGTDALLSAEFTYNVEEWKPLVEYTITDGKGRLTITQPDAEGKSTPGGAENRWTLELAENVPIDLTLDLGVGEANLNLGNLMLSDLSVDHGVGEITVNLVGSGITDLEGTLDAGVGKVTVLVPTGVGVRVDADTGIGELRTIGLSERDGYLINDAYDRSDHTIHLNVDAGVGSITVQASGTGSASM